MADVPNAKRGLWQATYTPVKADQRTEDTLPGRAFEKWSLVMALAPSRVELADLERGTNAGADLAVRQVREILQTVLPARGAPSVKVAPRAFGSLSWRALVEVARALVELRRTRLADLAAARGRIWEAYLAQQTTSPPRGRPSRAGPLGWKPVAGVVLPSLPGVSVFRRDRYEKRASPRGTRTRRGDGESAGELRSSAVLAVQEASTPMAAVRLPQSISLRTLLVWALEHGVEAAAAQGALAFARDRMPVAATVSVEGFDDLIAAYLDHLRDLIDGFEARAVVEPVGFLHLERLDFTPVGIERGELVHSVPLAPGEEVNITHREWSQTTEELQKIVTDFLEDFSEEGVAEKSELAMSASSQHQHSSGLNTGVTASGGYGPVSITASVSRDVADASASSEQSSRNTSIAVTRKASSRVKKEHRMSFKVASASGTEDQTVQRLKNPFTDRSTRVDYYQLIRKWKVDLHRYGIRLTYDVAIPEPGSDVLTRIREMTQLQEALEQGFGAPSATTPWARFDVRPNDITRENFLLLAATSSSARR